MKKYLYIAAIVFVLGLFGYASYEHSQAQKYAALYEVAAANNKAYEGELKENTEKARVYQFTIADLKQSNDSLIGKLNEVQKERKIKDKELQALSYQLATATRTDTIVMPDTIFVPQLAVDTTIVDKWYKLNLSLRYPSSIGVTPTFNSERYVIISAQRETINKPSKIFFIRWFQKKHTVINVDVEEKNPYISIDKQKFIKVIK